SFDACVFEMIMALCQGGSLYLAPSERVVGGEGLREVLERHEITHATLPPAVLVVLPEEADLKSIRVLITAGDRLTEALARQQWNRRRLINAYGPTETTVWAALYECCGEESGDPPIGKPIANTRIYILDRQGEPAPLGVTGELYIGGAGVAR